MIEALGIPILDSLSDNPKGKGWWYCPECEVGIHSSELGENSE